MQTKQLKGYDAEVFEALLANPQNAKVLDSDGANTYTVDGIIKVKKEDATHSGFGSYGDYSEYSGYHIILRLRDAGNFYHYGWISDTEETISVHNFDEFLKLSGIELHRCDWSDVEIGSVEVEVAETPKSPETFKVGDKVYCPRLGVDVYTLESNPSKMFPFSISNRLSLTEDGKHAVCDVLPTIVKATLENKAALETLYGAKFADPKFKNVEESKLPCLCLMADNMEIFHKIKTLDDAQNSSAVLDIYIGKADDDFDALNQNCFYEHAVRVELKADGTIEFLD